MYNVFTDGASRGNPGPSSWSYVIYDRDILIEEHAAYLGITTNNQAEYAGLWEALKRLLEMKATNIAFYSDSELIVKQLNKEYKVRHPELKKIYLQVMMIIPKVFPVQFHHIPREKNKRADYLCNQILNQIQTQNEEAKFGNQ